MTNENDRQVELECPLCEHTWETHITNLYQIKNAVFRSDNSVKRLTTCPNCRADVIVHVPADWVD